MSFMVFIVSITQVLKMFRASAMGSTLCFVLCHCFMFCLLVCYLLFLLYKHQLSDEASFFFLSSKYTAVKTKTTANVNIPIAK